MKKTFLSILSVLWLVCANTGSTIHAQMTMDGDGNVGIGTSSPTEKLTLSGGNFLQTAGAPKHMGSLADDEATALNGATRIHVSGKYAYVASILENGVEVLDISVPSNPIHVGSIIDNGDTALAYPMDIFVSGKYAYVAGRNDNGVEILDISNPSAPEHAGAIFDDGTTALRGACSIYVSGNYAYVGSYFEGVEILDISDPSNPVHAGSISDDGSKVLGYPRDIHVSGKYAYVAAQVDNGVGILDVSDPSNPTHVGSIIDDESTALAGASCIHVYGRYAYVAGLNDNGVEILDVSNPSTPTHVGVIFDNDSMKLAGPYGIYVAGSYAYVGAIIDDAVAILDISDPSNPFYAGAIVDDGVTELDGPTGIWVSGKYAYVVSDQDDGVEVLDIAGIDAPAASIGSIATDSVNVSDDAQIGNTLSVGGGLNVGSGGIKSDGSLAAQGDASFSGDINLNGPVNVNDFLKLTPQSSPPGSPENGDMYYDNSGASHALYIYINGSWQMIAGAALTPKTGQTNCYDISGNSIGCAGTGQDGDLQTGLAWPSPRFTDNNDGTVTDNLTRLVWLKNADCASGTKNWAEALAFANALHDGWDGDPTGSDCGLDDGSSAGDWHLPNIRELHSLVHLGYYGPALSNAAGDGQWTHGDPFTVVRPSYYWSSSSLASATDLAWHVYLYYGYVNFNGKASTSYVWPVREGQ